MRWIALLGLSALLSAADFNGTWIGQIPGDRGQIEDVAFQFIQKGNELTGKQYVGDESTPILKGTISGDLVMFVLVRQEQAGNEINQTRTRFTGRMQNGEIELVRERESSVRSGSGAAASLKKSSRQAFRLQKLI